MQQAMEGEDFKTLEAALALIEEYDDDSSAGSSSDSGDARCADVFQLLNQFPGKEMKTAAPNDRVESDKREIERLKAKLSFPRRNRSRDLHRLELLELRVEAAVLQREVDKLEEVHRLARSRVNGLRLGVRSTEETSLAEATDDLYDTWRNLAKKHKAYRRKAEIENRNLRELYTHQLKTTNTIKKLLRKQSCVKQQLAIR